VGPGCLSRIILTVLATVLLLGWYVISSNNRVADEYQRCAEDGQLFASDSFDRATLLVEYIENLKSGRQSVESALQSIAEVRADAEGIKQLVEAQATESRCTIPFKPLVKLVDLERGLGLDAAELTVVIVREEQLKAEIENLKIEVADYSRRFDQTGQQHLRDTAREFTTQIEEKDRSARRIQALVNNHERSYLAKKNSFFELAETTFGLTGGDEI